MFRFQKKWAEIICEQKWICWVCKGRKFSQSLPPGPHFFVDQVHAALNCFNLISVWAYNRLALADDWHLFHPTFSPQEVNMREARYFISQPYNDSMEFGSFLPSLRVPQLSRAPGNEETKAILQILGYSRKTAGEQRTSCTDGTTPTQRAPGMKLLIGLFLRVLQKQWPVPTSLSIFIALPSM